MTRTIDTILSRNLRRHMSEGTIKNFNPVSYKTAFYRAGRQINERRKQRRS